MALIGFEGTDSLPGNKKLIRSHSAGNRFRTQRSLVRYNRGNLYRIFERIHYPFFPSSISLGVIMINVHGVTQGKATMSCARANRLMFILAFS